MKHNIKSIISVLLLTVGTYSCSDESAEINKDLSAGKNVMEFTFTHPSQTRATDTSFENGDVVGLYVAESDKNLEVSGNTVNNQGLTFNGTAWNASRPLYWNEGTYNVFAYYPHLTEVSSISDLPFEVTKDQSVANASGMSGYEASDFLFATAKGVTASANPVNLQFSHVMSKLSIRLVKGEDFEGDIPEHATVYIHNTVTEANIDLMAGVATKAVHGKTNTLIARQEGATSYSAIIVPQRLDNRVPLVEVVMNGVSFLYESKFQFKPGIHHIVSLVVDKNPDQVKIEVGGEITDWN